MQSFPLGYGQVINVGTSSRTGLPTAYSPSPVSTASYGQYGQRYVMLRPQPRRVVRRVVRRPRRQVYLQGLGQMTGGTFPWGTLLLGAGAFLVLCTFLKKKK